MKWRRYKERPEINQTIYAMWKDHIYKCVFYNLKYHPDSKDFQESILISFDPSAFGWDENAWMKRRFIPWSSVDCWIPVEELNLEKGE
jgi:hypothetical protein